VAANHLIAVNIDRMKPAHPIRIDRHRAMLGPGGDFGRRDTLCHGKIQLVQVADGTCQAQAVVAELRRLRQLGVTDWSSIAVLSREHGDLARVRTLAERESIPIRWVAGRNAMPPLHQVREVNQFLAQLSSERNSFKPASELCDMAAKMFETKDNNVWTQFLNRLLEAWKKESGNAELPVQDALEFFYEACAESRREFTYGDGVTLSTVHSAKGTEFDHGLLIGPWRLPGSRKAQEEERRTFYVGLTRARKTLAVFDRKDIHPSLPEELVAPGSIQYQFTTEPGGPESIWLDYKVISLEDIHLGYPGQFGPKHRIHKALAALSPGDKLIMRSLEGNGIGLFDRSDECVARFSRTAQANWAGRIGSVREVRVLAIVRRNAEQDTQETRRERYLVQEWEIPVVEVVFADDSCG
jgi:ATP-dependent DNA helicase RecQ